MDSEGRRTARPQFPRAMSHPRVPQRTPVVRYFRRPGKSLVTHKRHQKTDCWHLPLRLESTVLLLGCQQGGSTEFLTDPDQPRNSPRPPPCTLHRWDNSHHSSCPRWHLHPEVAPPRASTFQQRESQSRLGGCRRPHLSHRYPRRRRIPQLDMTHH